MRYCSIDQKYLNYLRQYESRIPFSEYGNNHFKPFFHSLFDVGDLEYVAQLNHPQRRHRHMRNNMDFKKIFDGNNLLGVVNLNYMFPVCKQCIISMENFGDIDQFRSFNTNNEKSSYIFLLRKEMREMERMGLDKDAKRLYRYKNNHPNSILSNRCFDFNNLETKARNYV